MKDAILAFLARSPNTLAEIQNHLGTARRAPLEKTLGEMMKAGQLAHRGGHYRLASDTRPTPTLDPHRRNKRLNRFTEPTGTTS